ncbi:hypothetical protein N1851_030378 [Merluccius polli]|uniref:Uncharacterized protein n=1 Tax=Merluccius polli TaxID=89951 RepID=A0AA47NRU1_MERPO|nr:hypothetical protein N1851_030378 [Merluccius polli]
MDHLASRAFTFLLQFALEVPHRAPRASVEESCQLSCKTSLGRGRLEEPLAQGSRLDIQSNATLGLASMLIQRGTLPVRQLVDVEVPVLDKVEAVGCLGMVSGRYMKGLLNLWTQRLTERQRRLLRE